ncbi:hypothetical protein BO71DRAFT_93212 [Aspergillus ellipticus CBS 707.79]|uniref:Uncharacterized protein n=1 Tax=Aspergillus ellipticus CBS 707.79 TaxID=1448320 RepID=A0A319CZ24_9EURO|nr:hypothetical protein BO71DRAFT_93212 [Aspergillus ellipticus CBS 707.79]
MYLSFFLVGFWVFLIFLITTVHNLSLVPFLVPFDRFSILYVHTGESSTAGFGRRSVQASDGTGKVLLLWSKLVGKQVQLMNPHSPNFPLINIRSGGVRCSALALVPVDAGLRFLAWLLPQSAIRNASRPTGCRSCCCSMATRSGSVCQAPENIWHGSSVCLVRRELVAADPV